MSENELVFTSNINPNLTVTVIFPESDKYSMLSPQFEKSGHAFLLHDQNMLVVDGAVVNEEWFTMDHLLVIEAHEIGHWLAGHGKDVHTEGRDENVEREADWLGYNLLLARDDHRAASQLHREEYLMRYGEYPEQHDDLMTHLKQSLDESNRLKDIIDALVEDLGKRGPAGFHGYGSVQPYYVKSSRLRLGFVEKEMEKEKSRKGEPVKISRAFLNKD